ncbi:hypothetical protein J437_LFUL017354 [Ladona fulva]|uniref:Uncharacterized protein n=1 Tax=Ladona fulva TaxID=123851 RepID=A0A8K0KQ80_LADFU|nr:hypothetical protein J437_LFUL017354 [Ladona fulva]
MSGLINEHAPILTRCLKDKPTPWIADSILSLMWERDLAFTVDKEIRVAKVKFANELLKCSNGRALWNGLSKLGIGKNKSTSFPLNITSKSLNNYFINNYTQIAGQDKKDSLHALMNQALLTKSV